MKSTSLFVTSLVSPTLFAAGISLLGSSASAANFVLEPGVGAMLESNVLNTTSTSGTAFAPQFEMHAAYEVQNLFTSLDGRINLVDFQGSGNSGLNYALGISGGGVWVTVPLRLSLGLDFVNSYSDGQLSMGGSAFRMSFTYFLSEKYALNFNYIYNNFTSVSSSATGPLATVAPSAGTSSVGLSFSMPFYLDPPTNPWRPQRP